MSAYRVALHGRMPDAAMRILSDLGATPLGGTDPTSTVEVVDQAALVGLLNRMHSLGMIVDHVSRVD